MIIIMSSITASVTSVALLIRNIVIIGLIGLVIVTPSLDGVVAADPPSVEIFLGLSQDSLRNANNRSLPFVVAIHVVDF